MSLSSLVNGADCGPSNALQGLSKQFDHDRGLQQDFFGPGHASSSKETFRTRYATTTDISQDAAKFFSSSQSPMSPGTIPSSFDLSALRASLPLPHVQAPMQMQPRHAVPSSWALDFMKSQPTHASPLARGNAATAASQENTSEQFHNIQAQSSSAFAQNSPQFRPAMMGLDMGRAMPNNFQQFPAAPLTAQLNMIPDGVSWDEEFQSREEHIPVEVAQEVASQEVISHKPRVHDADALARTAGMLLNTVVQEQNPKFKNSQFLGLMRQLRDGEVVVNGNDMVPNEQVDFVGQGQLGNQPLLSTSAKGKGRANDIPAFNPSNVTMYPLLPDLREGVQLPATRQGEQAQREQDSTTEIDEYFRKENEDYMHYWNRQVDSPVLRHAMQDKQSKEWVQLQRDWDSFEATAAGLRPMANYQFQPNNPYLVGDSSRLRHHTMHTQGSQALYESVLALEAAVQRDPTNALAWFDLGVKQQENEREQKAVNALRRALELDPSHLPSWLALAISCTNEGDRMGAYDAIRQWVSLNERYQPAVQQHRTVTAEPTNASMSELFHDLIQCLIAMVRSDTSGTVDADIQIAIAVLLNTNEEYAKARDCFTAALAVRPEDWLLYNRVGATLANSGRPEEALQYYYRALELNPLYIRARFNLGISCINLRRHQEAAQHILDALVLQDSDRVTEPSGEEDRRGVTSSALWDSLKACCVHMQRIDLATLCDRKDLNSLRMNLNM